MERLHRCIKKNYDKKINDKGVQKNRTTYRTIQKGR